MIVLGYHAVFDKKCSNRIFMILGEKVRVLYEYMIFFRTIHKINSVCPNGTHGQTVFPPWACGESLRFTLPSISIYFLRYSFLYPIASPPLFSPPSISQILQVMRGIS